MSNSKLVDETIPSPNNSGARKYAISRITPHCAVAQCSIESLGALFANPDRRGSSNYGIGTDGRVGLFVDESCRAWTSGSPDNDNRAVTIECASDNFQPYAFNDKVYSKLVELCADICIRYGRTKLVYLSKESSLYYEPKSDEMLFTLHRYYQPTACPGDWLVERMPKLISDISEKIERIQEGTIYRVQVGAFTKKKNADELCARLKNAGFESAFVVKK